jgi:endonuclease/exonuclease/phosphatase family metal-dependent hydrolase
VHWNVAGWSMHRGSPEVAEALAAAVLEMPSRPLAVTVNELCDGQYDVLRTELGGAGYQAASAWSIPDFGQAGCGSYGNAIFWRGGDGGVERWTYPDALQVDGAATVEKRNALRVTVLDPPIRIATTHPHPDRRWAAAQVGYAADLLADQPGDLPTVLAGDLNLTPWNSALTPWYRRGDEADRLPRRLSRPTHRSLRKLDYVFAPRGTVRIAGPLRLSWQCRLSDHARLSVPVALVDSRERLDPGQRDTPLR